VNGKDRARERACRCAVHWANRARSRRDERARPEGMNSPTAEMAVRSRNDWGAARMYGDDNIVMSRPRSSTRSRLCARAPAEHRKK
jgi:hypothetical protein